MKLTLSQLQQAINGLPDFREYPHKQWRSIFMPRATIALKNSIPLVTVYEPYYLDFVKDYEVNDWSVNLSNPFTIKELELIKHGLQSFHNTPYDLISKIDKLISDL